MAAYLVGVERGQKIPGPKKLRVQSIMSAGDDRRVRPDSWFKSGMNSNSSYYY